MINQALEPAQNPFGNHTDGEYSRYMKLFNINFSGKVAGGADGVVPLFTTDAEGLWDAYLDSFPDNQKQYHNCNCCRNFITHFGSLVTIGENGVIASPFWNEDNAPDFYKPGVIAMSRIVQKAKVTGVFLSEDKTWGNPKTGWWNHLAVVPPKALVFKNPLVTAHQRMAEKLEDYKNINRALSEFTKPMLEQALTLLKSDALYRSEKVLGPAQWLYDLQVARESAPKVLRGNVTWKAIATAPAGFCHPRSSMIGTLLDDIASGMGFADVSKRFAAKMHPLKHQRPQAAPTAGNIAAAEKIVSQLNAAGALQRRIARLEEVQALWRNSPPKEVKADGVFSHLAAKGTQSVKQMNLPVQTMTWDKFSRTVLPEAESIEFYTKSKENFTAFVTAENPDAPPIIQWDREDKRNPVSWYVWNGGAPPTQYGLSSNKYQKVAAVTLKPSMWGDTDMSHQGEAAVFLLEGARETRVAGAALFPEVLKSEFHGIRATIEAYSRNAKMGGLKEGSACGVMLPKGQNWDARVRVTSKGQTLEYQLDRWD